MKWKAGALVLAVFLAGALVGGLGIRVFGDRIFSTGAAATNVPLTRGEFLQQLDQTLALTPDQHNQISSIMDDTVHTLSTNMEDARQHGRQRIRGVLTPEQLPKFETFLRQLDERRKKAEQERK